MKKLICIALTLVFSMALLTGCTEGSDNSGATEPTPTPVATPVPEDKPEEDGKLAYETVLAMWKDMDGYWAGADGGYLLYTLDDEGKAVLYTYDRHDALLSYAKAEAVSASNKTAYIMEYDCPVMDTDELKQGGGKATFVIEIAGFADGIIELTDEAGNKAVYVYVGENLDNLYDSVQEAKKLS